MKNLFVMGWMALSLFVSLPLSAQEADFMFPWQQNWTMLVFLNGNNSLDRFGATNIKQMEKVGSTKKVNVVVQWASYSGQSTKRFLVQKSTDPSTVTSPVVQDLGVVDMGDYNSLVDFIKWGVANYPARHYFIDVWDHGGGWHIESQMNLSNQFALNDISEDDNSGHIISTAQLGLAMKSAAQAIGHKVDLYASDACLMAMPEVATEMADSVKIFAGSEQTEPAAGWPYDTLLTEWNKAFYPSPAKVAKILTDVYVKSYENGSNGSSEVTFSAFNLAHSSKLFSSLSHLGEILGSASSADKAKILAAMSDTQTFESSDYGDLGDFLKHLESSHLDADSSAVLEAVNKALGKYVIASSATPGAFSRATGLSVWLPTSGDLLNNYWNRYSSLKFEEKTHWGEALKALLTP